jgi:cation diffusion facilitator CzcD-associated flavoprotein CzcO
MLTTISELKGFEEPTRNRRPVGLAVGEYHPGRSTWHDRRHTGTTELGVTEQPYCLVVGAGHCGLALGARLKQLNVPTLLIDRLERPSDVWRNRYYTLVLNSPSGADAMPYLSYPENWPAFPSKDQLANWLDAYASIMELNIWGGAECRRAIFDEARDEWNVDVLRDGRMTTLRPKQLVFATGLMGRPHIPAFPGASSFKGEQLHSSALRTCRAYAGQRCVVVGADVSGHDICAALWEAGADVTMVQRSPTIIVQRDSLMSGFQELYSDEAIKHGITPEKADLLFASLPFRLMERQQTVVFSEIRRRDADFYQQLETAGFQLSYGKDASGLVPQIFRRGAGYYVNVGASELIIRGDIKLRSRVEIEAINERGLQLSDGSELAADVIIYATGYDREKPGEPQGNRRQNLRLRLRRSWRSRTMGRGVAEPVETDAPAIAMVSRRRLHTISLLLPGIGVTDQSACSLHSNTRLQNSGSALLRRLIPTAAKSRHPAIPSRSPRFIQRRAALTQPGDTFCRYPVLQEEPEGPAAEVSEAQTRVSLQYLGAQDVQKYHSRKYQDHAPELRRYGDQRCPDRPRRCLHRRGARDRGRPDVHRRHASSDAVAGIPIKVRPTCRPPHATSPRCRTKSPRSSMEAQLSVCCG